LQNNTMASTGVIIKSDTAYESVPSSAERQSKKSALDTYVKNLKRMD
jgi:hypothetical protein